LDSNVNLIQYKTADDDLKKPEKQLDAIKAPWTPGRIPHIVNDKNWKSTIALLKNI
jgi:hypothetical protein